MIVLDTTIVNVALPSIRADLGFSETSLAWVVNAYLLTFGGFLLLGGRLGDLFGHRRLFLAASRSSRSRRSPAGSRQSQGAADRGARGAGPRRRGRLGGRAVADHDALHRAGRARQGDGRLRLRRCRAAAASACCSAACSPTRSTGTGSSSSTCRSASPSSRSRLRLLPAAHGGAADGRLDVAGAVTVTAALMLAVYAIVNGNEAGWTSAQTLGLLGVAVALLVGVPRDRVARRARRSCRSACSGCATSRPRTSSACSGRRRCSRGSSSPRSTCSWCSATRRSRSGSRSCRRT